jgi:hypothetical protein
MAARACGCVTTVSGQSAPHASACGARPVTLPMPPLCRCRPLVTGLVAALAPWPGEGGQQQGSDADCRARAVAGAARALAALAAQPAGRKGVAAALRMQPVACEALRELETSAGAAAVARSSAAVLLTCATVTGGQDGSAPNSSPGAAMGACPRAGARTEHGADTVRAKPRFRRRQDRCRRSGACAARVARSSARG